MKSIAYNLQEYIVRLLYGYIIEDIHEDKELPYLNLCELI